MLPAVGNVAEETSHTQARPSVRGDALAEYARAVLPTLPDTSPELTMRVLGRFFARLPQTIEAAPRHEHHLRLAQDKRFAVKLAEIRPHYPGRVNAIVVDVDRPNALTSWDTGNLLPPNIVTVFPETGRAHLIWLLELAVDTANERAMGYLRDIRADIVAQLDADRAYCGFDMTHSPFSPTYEAHAFSEHWYTLHELRAGVPRPKQTYLRLVTPLPLHSRNCYVFRTGLAHAYGLIHRGGDPHDVDFARDLYDVMVGAAAKARVEIPNEGEYADAEIGYSHKSVLRYARQRHARRRPEARSNDRNRKRAERGSVDRATYTARAEQRRAEIAQLTDAGLTVAAVAIQLKCSEREVYRLKQVNAPTAKFDRPPAASNPDGLSALQGYLPPEPPSAVVNEPEVKAEFFESVPVRPRPVSSIEGFLARRSPAAAAAFVAARAAILGPRGP